MWYTKPGFIRTLPFHSFPESWKFNLGNPIYWSPLMFLTVVVNSFIVVFENLYISETWGWTGFSRQSCEIVKIFVLKNHLGLRLQHGWCWQKNTAAWIRGKAQKFEELTAQTLLLLQSSLCLLIEMGRFLTEARGSNFREMHFVEKI